MGVDGEGNDISIVVDLPIVTGISLLIVRKSWMWEIAGMEPNSPSTCSCIRFVRSYACEGFGVFTCEWSLRLNRLRSSVFGVDRYHKVDYIILGSNP